MRASMEDLTLEVRRELAAFDYPTGTWTADRTTADGRAAIDVLIVGAGQSGLTTALRLIRSGLRVLVVDAAPAAAEGPWGTWARMNTLRTAKELYGTEAGIRSASFRTWYDATRGEGAFDGLSLIPRVTWLEYLVWLRHAARLPVRNDTRVVAATPDGDGWDVVVETDEGTETIAARKVVVCTGIDGAGGPYTPPFLQSLDPAHWMHSSEQRDLSSLAGKRVAVLGLGASAFDNAAVALESGAAEVVHIGRRSELPTLNAYRYLEKKGLFHAYSSLPDDVRIGFARAEMSVPMPPPPHSVDRCTAHENYRLELGVRLDEAHRDDRGVVLGDGDREWAVDFVIAATGFVVDLSRIGWLAAVADDIERWGDAHELGADALDRSIAAHPYLGPGMACRPRHPWSPSAVRNLHFANLAAHVSYGIVVIGLNGLPWAVDNLHDGIVRDLAVADAGELLAGFESYLGDAAAPVLPSPAEKSGASA